MGHLKPQVTRLENTNFHDLLPLRYLFLVFVHPYHKIIFQFAITT
jgi:hypothetical protein